MEKFTKIVATVSDKRCEPEFVARLAAAGVNVVRMNSAHLEREGFERIVANVRQAAPQMAIMMDTKGPEIRTTATETGDPIQFEAGDEVIFEGDADKLTSHSHIYLNYPDIAADLHKGVHILIDDGELDFEVKGAEGRRVQAVAMNRGRLGSRKSINIPGVSISLPAVSERDRQNIGIAAELGVDFIAHSFVRSARDVRQVEAIIRETGSRMKIISKVENQEGVDNFDQIVEASYGIMIARGDLGIEVAAERIPGIQQMMISRCIRAHKPVIVATQMLHSMIENPRPTRAEVSDVAYAVYQRADALMLSGETASGRYPVEAVMTMTRVAREVEQSLGATADVPVLADKQVTSFLARQAVVSLEKIGTQAVIADSHHGLVARYIASFRGNHPTVALCYNQQVWRWLALSYGVLPVLAPCEGYACASGALQGLIAQGIIGPDTLVAYLSSSDQKGATALQIAEASKL